MDPELQQNTESRKTLLAQMAECIRETGRIEISEQVVCPDSLEYTNRVHNIPASHYDSDIDFVMDYRAPTQTKVY